MSPAEFASGVKSWIGLEALSIKALQVLWYIFHKKNQDISGGFKRQGPLCWHKNRLLQPQQYLLIALLYENF